jgi:hypothetical protein
MQTPTTYQEARACLETVLIRGRFFKADIFITRLSGERRLVKDYSQKGFWERNLIGRLVIGREARAYRALDGVPGIPQRFIRLSPYSFAIEYLEGLDFGALERGELTPDLIHRFEKIVNGLHERGWVHLDLHRRTNILLAGGGVFVVDLASALNPGAVPLIGRRLSRLIGLADRLSLIKMKTLFAPELLSRRELKWLKIRNRIMPTKWKIS